MCRNVVGKEEVGGRGIVQEIGMTTGKNESL
jgi:hypothetical protein